MSDVNYETLVAETIRGGIEAVHRDYHRPDQENKRDGSVKGFNDCRGKTPEELAALLNEANERAEQAMRDDADDYWFWRCRAAEVEWVCNVVSAALRVRLAAHLPTGRGLMRAAEIVGVAHE